MQGGSSGLGGTAAGALGSAGGGGSGGAASGLSLASLGLSAASSIMQSEGTASADTYKAEQLEQAAQYGELKASQTNAQMTRNLGISLGNIDAVRAAANTSPTSPTGGMVRESVEQAGVNQKNIKVDSINAQAQEDEANAQYLRQASSQALLGGDIGAASTILKGAAQAAPFALAAL